jgi:hypothetical protein
MQGVVLARRAERDLQRIGSEDVARIGAALTALAAGDVSLDVKASPGPRHGFAFGWATTASSTVRFNRPRALKTTRVGWWLGSFVGAISNEPSRP